MKIRKLRNRMYYMLMLSDDRWYNYKKRWWYDYDIPGNKSTNQEMNTQKKLNKALSRLKHEGYKGIARISRHTKYVGEKGHLWEDWVYNFSNEKWEI